MEGFAILKRSSLLSLLLLIAIAFVGMRSYQHWQEGPWELPKPGKGKDSSVIGEPKKEPQQPQLASTKSIIEKNLFDPERGASRTKEAEASSLAIQRIRSMVLLGTAILGNSRYAILESPSEPRSSGQRSPSGQPSYLRLKLGDAVEGFKLTAVDEKKVVFTKGASRVEVALDFSRRVEEAKQKSPAPPAPRPGVAPRIPRGEAAPPARTP